MQKRYNAVKELLNLLYFWSTLAHSLVLQAVAHVHFRMVDYYFCSDAVISSWHLYQLLSIRSRVRDSWHHQFGLLNFLINPRSFACFRLTWNPWWVLIYYEDAWATLVITWIVGRPGAHSHHFVIESILDHHQVLLFSLAISILDIESMRQWCRSLQSWSQSLCGWGCRRSFAGYNCRTRIWVQHQLIITLISIWSLWFGSYVNEYYCTKTTSM